MKTDDEIYLEMRRWWINEIKAITAKVTAAEEKRQERIVKRNQLLMGIYDGWTYNDFHEAYGMGAITEKQFDKYTRLLEGQMPQPDRLYQAKIELLQELYREQKEILREQEKAARGAEMDERRDGQRGERK